jgi:hypothetical protein
MKRQIGWLRVLQVTERIKKHLPWRCVLSGVILQEMIGGRKLLIIWRIRPERFLESSASGWKAILQIIGWGVVAMPGSRGSKENDERGA